MRLLKCLMPAFIILYQWTNELIIFLYQILKVILLLVSPPSGTPSSILFISLILCSSLRNQRRVKQERIEEYTKKWGLVYWILHLRKETDFLARCVEAFPRRIVVFLPLNSNLFLQNSFKSLRNSTYLSELIASIFG